MKESFSGQVIHFSQFEERNCTQPVIRGERKQPKASFGSIIKKNKKKKLQNFKKTNQKEKKTKNGSENKSKLTYRKDDSWQWLQNLTRSMAFFCAKSVVNFDLNQAKKKCCPKASLSVIHTQ